MRTRYGVSPWIHECPESRRPDLPRHKGDLSVDVVIVGGGLTGCAVAYAASSAGLSTVLLEADRIGHGSAGRSAGWLTSEPGPLFRDVLAAHGLRSARRVFAAWRRGATEGAALLKRLKIRCALERRDALIVATRETEARLRRERDARVAAGLDAAWLTSAQLARQMRLEAVGALRVSDGFTLDPYRACLGLASAARARKAKLFERSPVKKTAFTAKYAEVKTGHGVIRANTVVVTTGVAGPEFKQLRRHFTPRETYNVLTEPVAAAVRRQLGNPDVVLAQGPPGTHTTRWTDDNRLVVSGAAQKETPVRKREAVVVQRTGQLMYELLKLYPAISGLRPEFGWEAAYGETADGLMYIGAHRNYPRHLFALGGHAESVTGAFVAARIIARALQGEPDKADAVFAWTR